MICLRTCRPAATDVSGRLHPQVIRRVGVTRRHLTGRRNPLPATGPPTAKMDPCWESRTSGRTCWAPWRSSCCPDRTRSSCCPSPPAAAYAPATGPRRGVPRRRRAHGALRGRRRRRCSRRTRRCSWSSSTPGAGYLAYVGRGHPARRLAAVAATGVIRPPRRRPRRRDSGPATAPDGVTAPVEAADLRSPFRKRGGDQPAQPEGDPVLRLVLHPVRRPRVRLPGAVVPGARRGRAVLQPAVPDRADLQWTVPRRPVPAPAPAVRRRHRRVGALFVAFSVKLATASVELSPTTPVKRRERAADQRIRRPCGTRSVSSSNSPITCSSRSSSATKPTWRPSPFDQRELRPPGAHRRHRRGDADRRVQHERRTHQLPGSHRTVRGGGAYGLAHVHHTDHLTGAAAGPPRAGTGRCCVTTVRSRRRCRPVRR